MPSLGVLIAAGSVIGVVVHWLKRQGVDGFSLTVFVAASLVSLHYLHHSRNDTYTNDWFGHFHYARFLSEHWLSPFDYRGDQDHHPPLYYYLAGLVIAVASALHTIPILTSLRFLSWAFYLLYSGFGLLTLRQAGLTGPAYRACVPLLLFWPAGLHLASTINSQTGCYAFYAGGFYYALVWYQDKKPASLVAAVWFSCIAFMIRGNALILFGLILLFWWAARRQPSARPKGLSRRQRASVRKIVAISLLVEFGTFVNLSSPFVGTTNHIPPGAGHFLFFGFYHFLSQPFNDWSSSQSFWDYLFKTFIFGQYHWTSPPLALLLEGLLFAITLYAALPWLIAKRAEWKQAWPFAAGLIASVLFLVAFTVVNVSQPNQDARLIYPCIVCFVALYGQSQALLASRHAMLAAMLGVWLAWGFAALSAYFVWVETIAENLVVYDGVLHAL